MEATVNVLNEKLQQMEKDLAAAGLPTNPAQLIGRCIQIISLEPRWDMAETENQETARRLWRDSGFFDSILNRDIEDIEMLEENELLEDVGIGIYYTTVLGVTQEIDSTLLRLSPVSEHLEDSGTNEALNPMDHVELKKNSGAQHTIFSSRCDHASTNRVFPCRIKLL